MKNRRLIIIIFLSLFSLTLKSQINQNKKFRKTVKKIEKQEFLFEIYELTSKTIRLANRLNKIATEEDLIELSNKNYKLCFCYSFWVLSKRNSLLIDELYIKFQEFNNEDSSKQINDLSKNRSCVKVIVTDENFINEIYKEKKHIDRIKTAYNNGS